MNSRTELPGYPRNGFSCSHTDAGTWVHAGGVALTLGIVAIAVLPTALILPAVALGLFVVSLLTAGAARLLPEMRRGPARLLAAMLVFLAIVASILTDPDAVVPYLR